MNIRKNLISHRLITAIFYLLVIIFFLLVLKDFNWSALAEIDFDWRYLLLVLPVSIISRALFPLGWVILIQQYGGKPTSLVKLNLVYAQSWLGRYIPGKVMWIASKIYFAAQCGISKKVSGITALLEAGIQILTGLMVGIVSLMVSGQFDLIDARVRLFALLSLLGFAVFFTPAIFNFFFSKAYKLLRKVDLPREYHLQFTTLIKTAGVYIAIHLASGIPIFFIMKSVYPEFAVSGFLYLTGSFVLAGTIGILAIIAPSGLGVRDGIQLLMLSQIVPKEIAVAVIVMLRIWSIALDVIYFVLSWFIDAFLKQPSASRGVD